MLFSRLATSVRLLVPGLLLPVLTVGCFMVEYRPPPEPLTPDEIIAMSKEGTPPEEIIRAVRESRTIYRMDAKDVVNLSKQGVDESVIDYMMETERRKLERDRYYHGPYWDPWYWHYHHFPHAYYCW